MLPALGFYEGLFIAAAIVFNLLIAGIFIANWRKKPNAVRTLGVVWLLLALPLGAVFIHYLLIGVQSWVMAAFGLVFLYMLVELVLDYVLQYEFRSQWRTHIPYIILEYLALFSLIAIAIWIDSGWGWVVGASFWILLGCLIYLYAGRRRRRVV